MTVNQVDVRGQYRTSAHFDARVQLHERFSTAKQPWMEWVFDRLDLPAACRILELGCGTGNLWRDNAGRIPPGWEITLSDFSPGMLERAQHNLSALAGRFRFELLDAMSIPYGTAELDAVIANHMLYHVPDLDRVLAEIQRVLKPGGRFYAATNGAGHMRELAELVPPEIPYAPTGDVIAQFTLDNGRAVLERYFEDTHLYRMDNALLVGEAEPLVAYMLSRTSLYAPGTTFDEEQRRAVLEHVEARLRQHGGAIRITKDAGMFVARKAETT